MTTTPETQEYELRLYDETMATFSMTRSPGPLGEKATVVSDVRAVSGDSHLLPCGLDLSETGMLSWLRTGGESEGA